MRLRASQGLGNVFARPETGGSNVDACPTLRIRKYWNFVSHDDASCGKRMSRAVHKLRAVSPL